MVGAAIAAVAAFGFGVRAETSGRLKFGVENDTGAVLTGLEVASTSGGTWKTVSLELASVKTGESTSGLVARTGGECLYDVRAQFSGRAPVEQDGVDLCDLDADTLVLKD